MTIQYFPTDIRNICSGISEIPDENPMCQQAYENQEAIAKPSDILPDWLIPAQTHANVTSQLAQILLTKL